MLPKKREKAELNPAVPPTRQHHSAHCAPGLSLLTHARLTPRYVAVYPAIAKIAAATENLPSANADPKHAGTLLAVTDYHRANLLLPVLNILNYQRPRNQPRNSSTESTIIHLSQNLSHERCLLFCLSTAAPVRLSRAVEERSGLNKIFSALYSTLIKKKICSAHP